jgi:type II restriction endonuclease
LRLSNLVGGGNDDPLKRDIMNYDWDMVVVDEAHEGTKTLRGQNVIDRLKKENTVMLSLSGTPFNLYDDFKEEEIYTWDYVKEQRAKAQWEEEHYGDPNPYADLPHMNLFTFDLSKIMHDNEDADTSDFRFNEFFRTWTGERKKDGEKLPSKDLIGRFIHEDAVNDFLDMLVREDGESNYPYSTEEFRNKFKHTFWIVPGVKEAAALEQLLDRHDVFGHGNFKIVNVAGDGNIEDPNGQALQEVEDAIKNNEYTITLSCGKLTTGVSVPQWTAVFYLKGSEMTTAATYMQTIFRVQTHAVLDGEQKRECYVFDFAPSRALRVVAETAKMAVRAKGSGAMSFVKGTQEEEEEELGEFLKFCPVISLEEGGMIPYEPSKLFAQLKDVYVARAVQSGYADNSLYSSETLVNLGDAALAALDRISGKIGTTPNLPKPDTIDVGYKPMTDEEKKTAKKAEKKKKQKKPLTPEEQEALDKKRAERDQKKARISVLRGLSIRIPLLVYGAEIIEGQEDTELSISNFTTLVDQPSWDEFMPVGITKEDFDAIRDSYDPVIFREAGKRIRSLTRAADSMDVEERIERIATVFSYFHNPDKETVLTPWRVVNMHMADTVGGWSFYNEDFSQPNVEIRHNGETEEEYKWPRFVDQGKVTADVFGNYDARLLEINSKTGLYPLYLTYSLYRLWKTEYSRYGLIDKAERDDKVIWDSILNENIFVVCKTPMARAITRRTLVGFRRQDDGREIQVNAICPYWILNKAELVKKKVIKVEEGEYVSPNDIYKADLVEVLRFNPSIFEHDVVRPEWWEKVDTKAKIKLDRKIFKNMIKFDAVVGNPPYQLTVGKKETENGQKSVVNIFHFFQMASDTLGTHATLIYPGGRWIHRSGKGLAQFGLEQINDPHLEKVIFYPDSSDVFERVGIADGISIVLKNKTKSSPGFEYIYSVQGMRYSSQAKNPGEDLMPLNPFHLKIVDNINRIVSENGWLFLHDSVLSRCLFSIESDFVEKNPKAVREYEEGDFFDKDEEIKLFTNDKAGKSGRARWYVASKQVISTGRDQLNRWKVVVSSANAGGQKRSNQIAILDNHSAFGRSRVALKTFKTKREAENFFKYATSELIRFTFLLTDESLTSLAKQVPDIINYTDNNGIIDFSGDVNAQLYRLFNVDSTSQAHIREVLSNYPV